MKQNKILLITIMVADLILTALCMAAYFGEDRVEPEFRFQTDETIYSEADGEEVLLDNITAVDDKDGDISDRIVIEKITENRDSSIVVVYYAVSDSAGNVAKISRVFPAEFVRQENTRQEDMETYNESPQKDPMPIETLSEAGDENEPEEKGNEDGAEEDGDEEKEDVDAEDTDEDGEEDEDEEVGENTAGNGEENQADAEREETIEESKTQQESEQLETEQHRTELSRSPQLVLRTEEVTIDAGTSPPWTEIIEVLRDDKDNYETLYYNLSVSRFNRNQPGDYQVSLYTEDSDGNRSDTVSILVHVK